MFHIQNSINACTGYSADHIKWLTGVAPQGTIHPDLPRTVFQGSQVSLCLIWICVRLMYTSDNSAALGVGCIRSKSNINWMHWTWGESSFHTCRFWGKFVSVYFPTKICVLHLGRCRCSFLLLCVKELLTCKKMKCFSFWSGHTTVLPWTKRQELSTAIRKCPLTPQSCSVTKNKKRGSSFSHETKMDN